MAWSLGIACRSLGSGEDIGLGTRELRGHLFSRKIFYSPCFFSLEVHRSSDARRDISLWHSSGDLVNGLPASTMAWNDYVRPELLQLVEGWWNDLLEDPTCQVEAADEPVDLLYPCYSLGVVKNVDDSGVAAAGDDD